MTTTPVDFDSLAQAYLDEFFAENPTSATFEGWDGHDHESPDMSAAGIEAQHAREDRWLATLGALEDDDLTVDQQIDRDAVLATLRGSVARRDWQTWRRSPDGYLNTALMGVFMLFLRKAKPEHELIDDACARIATVPSLLAHGQENLDASLAAPIFVRRALGQCEAGARYFRELLPADIADEGLRQRVVDAAGPAVVAFEQFGSFLTDLAENASGSPEIGEEMYSAILEERELLGYGASTLHQKGVEAWASINDQMHDIAREIDPSVGSWRALMDTLNGNHPSTPGEMLDGYRSWTAKCRQFLVDHQLVTFLDGEECEVEPSAPFQRPVLAVASYYQPPAFKPSLLGRFNVPYPPDGVSDDEVQARLSNNGWHSMPTISAHEAYPGHHWHLVTMQQASPLRQVTRSAYFAEGWGLYSEHLMHEHGFFDDPRDALSHLDARIFRAARIVVDTALHCGEMTFDEAVAHMQANASLSEPTARAEVIRYLAWPTQAASYLTGCLEIERIRERYFEMDRGDLRSFHDTIAASGSLPIALAERAVLG